MKSLIVLWNKVADDEATWCNTSTTMDKKTVQGRFKHEGLSFLTITLPGFGKDFQKSLDQGLIADNAFLGFKKSGCLPAFLQGFTQLVFDRASGVLLDKPSIDAIRAVRQLTLLYSKLELPCTDARVRAAFESYVQCDAEVKETDSRLTPIDLERFSRVSSLLFRDVFTKIDKQIYDGDLVPKHGPGATAEKLASNQKYRLRTWTHRLEEVFSASEFLFPNQSHYFNEIDDVDFREPGSEEPVRVISVPKTLKTPRIIAIEPGCMQYAQQAVLEALVPELERDKTLSNMINFRKQDPNQILARKSSLNGKLATLDLSEASDRVSNQLVRSLVANWRWLSLALEATRSRKADVPGHGIIRLAKYASMGSALCFPVEAMVFCTMIFIGIEEKLGHHLTRADIHRYSDQVRVYGDDLIVPVDCVEEVISSLEHFGAQVGAAKSFWIGRFRESCGKEYYEGQDVSIVKVRQLLPSSPRHVQEVMSTVATRNLFYEHGLWGVAAALDDLLGSVLRHYPTIISGSPGLGRISFLGYIQERECEVLHRPLVKAYVVSSEIPRDPLDGIGALLKFFLKRGIAPLDRRHLERAGRPRTVRIKARWTTPY